MSLRTFLILNFFKSYQLVKVGVILQVKIMIASMNGMSLTYSKNINKIHFLETYNKINVAHAESRSVKVIQDTICLM
jgi:hypothetical protein